MSWTSVNLICITAASDGDLRRAITFLQSISNLSVENSPSAEDIYDVTGVNIEFAFLSLFNFIFSFLAMNWFCIHFPLISSNFTNLEESSSTLDWRPHWKVCCWFLWFAVALSKHFHCWRILRFTANQSVAWANNIFAWNTK